MQAFTDQRNEETLDEIWLLEHPPVFTLGQSGNREHIHTATTIPVLPIDRGGQVTYHGPGQLIAYTLIDLKRKGLSIRQFVTKLETAVIEFLAEYKIPGEAKCKAPGVYVHHKKICSIGLRVRRGYAFHGFALNLDMDLKPFSTINPCGYPGLEMTQLAEFVPGPLNMEEIHSKIVATLIKNLAYTAQQKQDTLR
jgi:lipoyl(octanoyl) transferase